MSTPHLLDLRSIAPTDDPRHLGRLDAHLGSGRDRRARPHQESTAALAPARDVDHAVHGLAHEHVALLELNKSNRGSPWTAISRRSKRSHFLRSGRPSAPSPDSSTRLSLALRRRSVGSLSCRRRRRHWSVSHVWLTSRRRAMAGHVSGSYHRETSCASSGWFTNTSRPPD